MKKYKELKHHNLLLGLHAALKEYLLPNQYATKVLERSFKKNKKWGSKDRAFISEAFYDIIRWKLLFQFYTQKTFSEKYLYDYIVAYLLKNNYQFPTWEELENVNFKTIKKQLKLEPTEDNIKYSFTPWMFQLFKDNIPNYMKEIKALNQTAEVVIRVNTLKTNVNTLQNLLQQEGFETLILHNYPDALQLKEKQNLFVSPLFKEGMFEVQDANSQKVAEAVQPEIGDRVIDACAGSGGKALHLACLMENKGQIIAMDIYQWKLDELKKRSKRDGIHNIQTKLIDDTKVLKRLKNTADKVLIDAPCSGLGVLKRNPDAKWKITEQDFSEVIEKQANILQNYSKLVKQGGTLTYVTCSIFPQENEQQVSKFLDQNTDFQLISQETLYPSITGYDGFYIARLIKSA